MKSLFSLLNMPALGAAIQEDAAEAVMPTDVPRLLLAAKIHGSTAIDRTAVKTLLHRRHSSLVLQAADQAAVIHSIREGGIVHARN